MCFCFAVKWVRDFCHSNLRWELPRLWVKLFLFETLLTNPSSVKSHIILTGNSVKNIHVSRGRHWDLLAPACLLFLTHYIRTSQPWTDLKRNFSTIITCLNPLSVFDSFRCSFIFNLTKFHISSWPQVKYVHIFRTCDFVTTVTSKRRFVLWLSCNFVRDLLKAWALALPQI